MRCALLLFAGALAAAADLPAQDAQALLRKYDCHLCHASDETKGGPSYAEIAAKYRNDPNAAAKLAAVVKKGAHGSGPWPMPPLPQVPDADARKIVAHILSIRN
jgi:cytochrome c551/c552